MSTIRSTFSRIASRQRYIRTCTPPRTSPIRVYSSTIRTSAYFALALGFSVVV